MSPPTDTKDQAPAARPKLRADAQRNRDSVLEAAQTCFARHGMECGIDHIAKKAGVGVGTVYRHFPTKGDLWAALVHDRFVRIAERTEEALTEDDPWEAFCELMRWSAEYQARDRALSEFLATNPAMGQHEAVETGLTELTAQLIKKAKASGGMRKDIVVEDVPTMICGLSAVTGSHAGSMPGLNWERYLEIVLEGMRNAPGQRKLPPPKGRLPSRRAG